jgi:hypothetical protein
MNSLSEQEKFLWNNSDIFLTKKIIIDKIYIECGKIIDTIKQTDLYKSSPIEFQNPKISKGENYLGLPWVMLDFPSVFGRENIFAFRVFFYWGKEINCFLILKGSYLIQFISNIKNNHGNPDFDNVLMYCGDNIWQHHLDESYVNLNSVSTIDLTNKSFIKLAIKINANEIERSYSLSINAWSTCSKLLSS